MNWIFLSIMAIDIQDCKLIEIDHINMGLFWSWNRGFTLDQMKHTSINSLQEGDYNISPFKLYIVCLAPYENPWSCLSHKNSAFTISYVTLYSIGIYLVTYDLQIWWRYQSIHILKSMWVTSADLYPNMVQCGEILTRGAIKFYAMSFWT